MSIRIFLLLLIAEGILYCPVSLPAQQQKFLTVELANRHLEGNVYHADIWLIVRPGAEWVVSECTIWVLFNLNALNPTAYIRQPVINADPELVANGYVLEYHYLPNAAAVSIDVISPGAFSACVVKGGPDGETFRLGTLRWNVTDYSAMDYVRFLSYDHPWLFHRFFARAVPPPDNVDIPIESIHWPQNDLSTDTWQNLYIAPSGCGNMFYEQPQNCGENLRPASTTIPLVRNSPHWPTEPGPGLRPHIAYYQYTLNPMSLPSAAHSRSLDYNRLPALLDQARCRWEAQVDNLYPPVTNYFEWRETTTGGRMYFTTNPQQMSSDGWAAVGALAVTNMARNETNFSFFKDSSACGGDESPSAFKGSSEIVFNNTTLLYAANPHLRWTTDLAGCGGGPDCISFYEVALHELGHYVGLAHEERNHTVVMTGANSLSPFPVQISQCDADNIRRLYNPTIVGSAPDNSFNCNLITDVKDGAVLISKNTIEAVPSHIDGEGCTIFYSLAQQSYAVIKVVDMPGNEVATLHNGATDVGRHQLHFSTEHLAAGVYLIVLQANGSSTSCKIVVTR